LAGAGLSWPPTNVRRAAARVASSRKRRAVDEGGDDVDLLAGMALEVPVARSKSGAVERDDLGTGVERVE